MAIKNININGVHHNATYVASLTKEAYVVDCAGQPYEAQASAIYDECCKGVGKPVEAPKKERKSE